MTQHRLQLLRSRLARQRGSSLLIIFLVLTVMSALAMAVLLTTRSDIKISGSDREHSVAFATAEAGLAYGKSFLTTQWNTTTGWSTLLQSTAATTGVTQAYDFGGVSGMPTVKARYTYRFVNNPTDPSASATVDTDGRILVVSTGVALDPSGTTVLATTTVQVEVLFNAQTSSKSDYQGQQNQDVSGAARAQPDTAALTATDKVVF
jgi:Tfp pilus assembly protein PilX